MTDKNTPASLEDLFNDTEEAAELENEILKDKAEEAADNFVPVAMRLKVESELKTEISHAVPVEHTETRNLKITLPKAAWEGLELMSDLFSMMEEYDDNALIPHDVRRTMRDSASLYEADLDETLVAQAALVNIRNFIEQMATSSLLAKVSEAMSSPDKLNQLEEVLKKLEEKASEALKGTEEDK